MAEDTTKRRQLPLFELDENPDTYPQIATVRELDAEVVGRRISFFFSRGTYFVDLTRYAGGLDGLLRDIREGDFDYSDNTSNRPDPPESPLSLNNQNLSYVVYKLSDKNWQFCRNHPPFSIGEEVKDLKIYFEARKFTPWGTKERVDIEHQIPVTDDCKVAYFIANGWKAMEPIGEYIHAINIHVDLVYEEGSIAYVPLVIDPDVRHPGGSGQ